MGCCHPKPAVLKCQEHLYYFMSYPVEKRMFASSHEMLWNFVREFDSHGPSRDSKFITFRIPKNKSIQFLQLLSSVQMVILFDENKRAVIQRRPAYRW